MLEIILFIFRYIPFWTIPIMIIALEFTYIYWLKSYARVSYFFGSISFICLLFIIYYFLAGSPDRSSSIIANLLT
ncbi:MAG: hypothetical protein A2381_09135 [Bdellovibrionales bacterium RIFOXYB1_FULL_37_110]|nr:MAG: hypothetical protein A2417_03520 [Bdellovibrionales bacterium RIFOXYC1_FULL_37_79]OFZ61049.1 MAG: hypothetical protein A2381_09135 [Bdellovibrionales bacterium RIFOXYB1_FULL_37_110]OFZ65174.1 MAG: hypothetical protein A2577_04995 [Bdellovibrionales bacterium RIFOXYD1_FULL_36_51]OFZ67773.1 MAG: hypothetical protein A2328_10230 [Bdellovibrionales bacterium RIFOXYB2_FULL_36_6]